MSIKYFMLRTGPRAGESRPAVVARDNGDGTADIAVFTASGDGLGTSGLLPVKRVRLDYLADSLDKAAEAGNASILAEKAEADKKAAALEAEAAKQRALAESIVGKKEDADKRAAELEAQARTVRKEADDFIARMPIVHKRAVEAEAVAKAATVKAESFRELKSAQRTAGK